MEKPNYYAIIPAEIRYDKQLTANAKLLYGEITSLCNEKGVCWVSNQYFADLYSTTKETISRWISQLAKKKYIAIKMFYKKDSKEIDKRIISISKFFQDEIPIDENVNTSYQENQGNNVLTKTSTPYSQKCQTPLDKNVKENITSINNINIYTAKNILQDNFEKIWKEYPHKKGKAKAFEYYKQWIKGRKISGITKKLTNEQIENAVRKYKEECKKNRTEEQYIKHGDTFFNKAILDYIEQEEEKQGIEAEYKEVKMTEEEYKQKMSSGGKRYV